MEKNWIALPKGYNKEYKTYEEAEEAAKRVVGNPQNGYEIYVLYEAVACAKKPVPDVEVQKLG